MIAYIFIETALEGTSLDVLLITVLANVLLTMWHLLLWVGQAGSWDRGKHAVF